jgi:translation initiation factor IF-3
LLKKPLVNNQIKAQEVRVIDEEGKQLGVLSLSDAFKAAQEKKLDLIQISEKAIPPVCKLMEYGKYLYWEGKKAKEATKHKGGETKGIRLTYNISQHDLETRVAQTKKFLEEGDRILLTMVLRGREKGMAQFATAKINQFLEILNQSIKIKIDRELKRDPRGFSVVLSRQ